MADQSIGSGEPHSHEAEILVVAGDGAEPTAALRAAEALRDALGAPGTALHQMGIAVRPSPDTIRVVGAPRPQRARGTWRHWLGIGALVALLFVGSAVPPFSQNVLAEAPLGTSIPTGGGPIAIAIDPAISRVYVANAADDTGHSVTVIDSSTKAVVGSAIPLKGVPQGIALNPGTKRAYVPIDGKSIVQVIDTTRNAIIGDPIPVGTSPRGIGVVPNTNRVYVSNGSDATVTAIDGATGTVMGTPIKVGTVPFGIAVNTATNLVYVADGGDGDVTVIDSTTNTVVGKPIKVGAAPVGIGVNSVTNRIYVTSLADGTVTVIDGATSTVVGSPIPAGKQPMGVGINPATNLIYVSSFLDATLTVIDGATNAAVGTPIAVGGKPVGVGVDPVANQIYVPSVVDSTVAVIGIPLSIRARLAPPGNAVSAAWNSLFSPNGGDLVGLFQPGAPNTSPLSRRFTNGTDSSGGAGVADGSVDLPVPSSLPRGTYEVRLVAGGSGATLARVSLASIEAANDTFTLQMSQVLTVPAPGVLANDTGPHGSALGVTALSNPAHGTLALQANGGFVYTPTVAFSGTDSFTYLVSGEGDLPATGTVTLTVTVAPVGANDAYTAASGSTLTVPAPGVLGNDIDPDSPSLQAILGTNPAHGTLHLQPDGSFTYTPAVGFSGADSFTYRATDQSSFSLPVMVALDVTLNACAPRPKVTVTASASVGKLIAHVQTGVLNTQQPNPLRSLRFGALQNARVTVGGQSIANGQTFTAPTTASSLDVTVERVTPGQVTTVPFTVVDGCGDWPTFVGGGPGAGF